MHKKLLQAALLSSVISLAAYIGHAIGTRQMIDIYGDVLEAEMITYLVELDLNK